MSKNKIFLEDVSDDDIVVSDEETGKFVIKRPRIKRQLQETIRFVSKKQTRSFLKSNPVPSISEHLESHEIKSESPKPPFMFPKEFENLYNIGGVQNGENSDAINDYLEHQNLKFLILNLVEEIQNEELLSKSVHNSVSGNSAGNDTSASSALDLDNTLFANISINSNCSADSIDTNCLQYSSNSTFISQNVDTVSSQILEENFPDKFHFNTETEMMSLEETHMESMEGLLLSLFSDIIPFNDFSQSDISYKKSYKISPKSLDKFKGSNETLPVDSVEFINLPKMLKVNNSIKLLDIPSTSKLSETSEVASVERLNLPNSPDLFDSSSEASSPVFEYPFHLPSATDLSELMANKVRISPARSNVLENRVNSGLSESFKVLEVNSAPTKILNTNAEPTNVFNTISKSSNLRVINCKSSKLPKAVSGPLEITDNMREVPQQVVIAQDDVSRLIDKFDAKILPVNVFSIYTNCKKLPDTSTYAIRDVPFKFVSFKGNVINKSNNYDNMTTFLVDDGSAVIKCKIEDFHWIKDDRQEFDILCSEIEMQNRLLKNTKEDSELDNFTKLLLEKTKRIYQECPENNDIIFGDELYIVGKVYDTKTERIIYPKYIQRENNIIFRQHRNYERGQYEVNKL